mmetsp:Transcript_3004/g.11809  ORF Transcript_3004/g.11809 Transcript_3004/m.11809 type:complete len:258 (+) Transcript_3004:734-1507(+)
MNGALLHSDGRVSTLGRRTLRTVHSWRRPSAAPRSPRSTARPPTRARVAPPAIGAPRLGSRARRPRGRTPPPSRRRRTSRRSPRGGTRWSPGASPAPCRTRATAATSSRTSRSAADRSRQRGRDRPSASSSSARRRGSWPSPSWTAAPRTCSSSTTRRRCSTEPRSSSTRPAPSVTTRASGSSVPTSRTLNPTRVPLTPSSSTTRSRRNTTRRMRSVARRCSSRRDPPSSSLSDLSTTALTASPIVTRRCHPWTSRR